MPARLQPVESAVKAHIHYEAAFEAYLQNAQIPYVAVDEAKRSAFRQAKLKSFDFIVYSDRTSNWLVDIKGRRWTPRKKGGKPTWENWVTQADLDGLRQWEEVFGHGFTGLLVFAYHIDPAYEPPPEIVFDFSGARYVFVGVTRSEYTIRARVRSQKWGTVYIRRADFLDCLHPITTLT